MTKKNIEHYQRRKLLNSYFSVVLSITFVLFFLGVLGLFLINGKIMGAISRVPKKGSFLSNMSKGAKPKTVKLTIKEKKVSKIIARDLKKEKIFFAGIDFIDQKLNGDINVTSPTGLKTLYDLSKINLAKIFWKELKA